MVHINPSGSLATAENFSIKIAQMFISLLGPRKTLVLIFYAQKMASNILAVTTHKMQIQITRATTLEMHFIKV